MKTLCKRILTACLALTMTLAAAAPAMAAEPRATSPVGHVIKLNSCGTSAGPALRANGNYNQATVDSSAYTYSTNQK